MEDLKQIIATFVKKETDEINEGTLINTTVIPGSILVHRMYAVINKAGYPIKNYVNINSYGELLARLRGEVPVVSGEQEKRKRKEVGVDALGAGIDVEHIDNLPKAIDLREDRFYSDTFSDREIAYALLKSNPYETLAGLFAAKEAICKADNSFRGYPFNEIAVEHNAGGAPIFSGFSLSISHSNGFSIAVAFKGNLAVKNSNNIRNCETEKTEQSHMNQALADKGNNQKAVSYISLVISIVALAITVFLLFSGKGS